MQSVFFDEVAFQMHSEQVRIINLLPALGHLKTWMDERRQYFVLSEARVIDGVYRREISIKEVN